MVAISVDGQRWEEREGDRTYDEQASSLCVVVVHRSRTRGSNLDLP